MVTVVNSHQPEPQESVYPEEIFGIPVHTELLPETLPARPGERRTIKYVVIHETGNTAEGSDAAGHSAYLLSGKSGDTSWHYTVDDHQIYHHIPDDEIAWHAGDRRTRDGGNLCGIGVELCVNEDGDFEKTLATSNSTRTLWTKIAPRPSGTTTGGRNFLKRSTNTKTSFPLRNKFPAGTAFNSRIRGIFVYLQPVLGGRCHSHGALSYKHQASCGIRKIFAKFEPPPFPRPYRE